MIHSLLTLLAQVVVNPNDFHVPKDSLGPDNLRSGLQLAFGVAGGVAFVIVTIAGLRYVISQGDPQETAKAKNAILYALIGLVICITAFSIVTFVIQGTT